MDMDQGDLIMQETTCNFNNKETHSINPSMRSVVPAYPVYYETGVKTHNKKAQYIVVTANSINELVFSVEAQINDGYLPQGGVVYVSANCYHQAMLLASLKL